MAEQNTHQFKVEFQGDAKKAQAFRKEVEKVTTAFKKMGVEAKKVEAIQKKALVAQKAASKATERDLRVQKVAARERTKNYAASKRARVEETRHIQSQPRSQSAGNFKVARQVSEGKSRMNQVMGGQRVGGFQGGYGGKGMPRGGFSGGGGGGKMSMVGGGGGGAGAAGGMAGKFGLVGAIVGAIDALGAFAIKLKTAITFDPLESAMMTFSKVGATGEAGVAGMRKQQEAFDEGGTWIKAFSGALAESGKSFDDLSGYVRGARSRFKDLSMAAAELNISYKDVPEYLSALGTVSQDVGDMFTKNIMAVGTSIIATSKAKESLGQLQTGAAAFGTDLAGYTSHLQAFSRGIGKSGADARSSLNDVAYAAGTQTTLTLNEFTQEILKSVDSQDEFTQASEQTKVMLMNLGKGGNKTFKVMMRFQELTKQSQESFKENFSTLLAAGGGDSLDRVAKELKSNAKGTAETAIVDQIIKNMKEQGMVTKDAVDFLADKLGPAGARKFALEASAAGRGIDISGPMDKETMARTLTSLGQLTGQLKFFAPMIQELGAAYLTDKEKVGIGELQTRVTTDDGRRARNEKGAEGFGKELAKQTMSLDNVAKMHVQELIMEKGASKWMADILSDAVGQGAKKNELSVSGHVGRGILDVLDDPTDFKKILALSNIKDATVKKAESEKSQAWYANMGASDKKAYDAQLEALKSTTPEQSSAAISDVLQDLRARRHLGITDIGQGTRIDRGEVNAAASALAEGKRASGNAGYVVNIYYTGQPGK